ncbi:MFS transporter [Peribacillus simplex]|uniref:MFS transporter n=1 Tax=Peribacillus simplex TaxID=1478 RepID=UPI00298D765A|nr:MFS transporter [Peribacillus simplex]MDW7617902.1 MFS transporter [Peribacillus simplex]
MTNQRWMSLQFFGFFFTFGIFVPYWSSWLILSKGFTADEAGLIIAMGLITRSITTFYIFPLACRYITLAQLNRIVPLASVVLIIVLIPLNNVMSVVLITILLSLIYPMPLAMHEAMASTLIRESGIQYGKSRSYGSIGYIFSLSLTGVIISLKDETVIIYLMIIGCIMFVLITSFNAPVPLKTKIALNKVPSFHLFKSKSFLLVLAMCSIIQAAHAAYYSYAVLFLKTIGIKTSFTGIILIIAVISEIVFFYISDILFKKQSVPKLLMYSISASIIRWLLIACFNSISVFIFSQLLHSITFGLTQFAFVKYLDEHVENKYFPFAHGIYAALALSLGSGILTIVSGYLYSISPSFSFLGMALICVPCLILCYSLSLVLNLSDQNRNLQDNIVGEVKKNATN